MQRREDALAQLREEPLVSGALGDEAGNGIAGVAVLPGGS
jgi:hypothetical protein